MNTYGLVFNCFVDEKLVIQLGMTQALVKIEGWESNLLI